MTRPKLLLSVNILIVATILIALSHVGWLFPEPVFSASGSMS